MEVPTIIGLSGKLGCGKDYTASHLLPGILETLTGKDVDIRVMALADQIKFEFAARQKNVTYDSLYVTKTTEICDALQKYGTEMGRDKYDDNMWIRALSLRIEAERRRHIGSRALVIVVPDIRFENEARWIESIPGAILIRLIAPQRNLTRLRLEGTEHLASHRSETSLDNYSFTHILKNDIGEEATVAEQLENILCNAMTKDTTATRSAVS